MKCLRTIQYDIYCSIERCFSVRIFPNLKVHNQLDIPLKNSFTWFVRYTNLLLWLTDIFIVFSTGSISACHCYWLLGSLNNDCEQRERYRRAASVHLYSFRLLLLRAGSLFFLPAAQITTPRKVIPSNFQPAGLFSIVNSRARKLFNSSLSRGEMWYCY
jgi:hypothetical protein